MNNIFLKGCCCSYYLFFNCCWLFQIFKIYSFWICSWSILL